jgi:hypothetical protein
MSIGKSRAFPRRAASRIIARTSSILAASVTIKRTGSKRAIFATISA